MFDKYKMIVIAVLLAVIAMAQLPVKQVDGTGTFVKNGAAGREVTYGMQLVPTSSTAVTSTTTKVQVIFCANTTGGAVTLTITDNQGSPVTYYPAVSLPANSATLLHSGVGLTFTSGIKWSAGTVSAVYCQIEGVQ